jgi:dTDP-4-dehydrorhamnose reductase
MTILVTGASGQLGSAFIAALAPDRGVVGLARADLDLTDSPAVLAGVAALRPALIVNCAAYNQVDAAETDPLAALGVNAIGVRTLARAAAETGATLVHFGTDFVFDGTGSRPYAEEDPPNPQSVYASSKLLGEWLARDVPHHYVLRVESLFGGPRRKSSVDAIIEHLRHGRPAPVFVDRIVSPSFVRDVVEATLALVERRAPSGVYHCVNDGHATWHELGREAARLLAVESRLTPTRFADVALPAPRPQYCALSNRKLADAGIVMPSWQDALARHIASLREES